MTKFLDDYGLKWVGDDEVFDQQPQPVPFNTNLPKEIDTEVLSRRIEELNFIAEKQLIVTNRDGMSMFKRPEAIPILFYRDGLMIEGFSFYPYHMKQA